MNFEPLNNLIITINKTSDHGVIFFGTYDDLKLNSDKSLATYLSHTILIRVHRNFYTIFSSSLYYNL